LSYVNLDSPAKSRPHLFQIKNAVLCSRFFSVRRCAAAVRNEVRIWLCIAENLATSGVEYLRRRREPLRIAPAGEYSGPRSALLELMTDQYL
jgi:hypothetical protein